MSVSYSNGNQTPQEQEVREALANYKMALINTHYRNWWHRLLCLVGDNEANESERSLRDVEQATRVTVNQSPAHQAVVRVVSSQQPENARNMDAFLALIH